MSDATASDPILYDVDAGAETAAVARPDDGPHLRVGVGLGEVLREQPVGLVVQGVVALRAVGGDGGDVTVDVVQDWIAHGCIAHDSPGVSVFSKSKFYMGRLDEGRDR